MMHPIKRNGADEDNSVALSDCSESINDAVGHKAHQEEERKNLAHRENQMVSCLRVAVYLVVLVTAILVCVGVFFYTQNNQQASFETEFAAYASKLVKSFHNSIESKIGAIQTFSTTITSQTMASDESFPNVTIPNFAMVGENMRIQSGAVYVNWMPLVTDETRAGWEEYASQHYNWIMPAFFKDLSYKAAQDARFGYTKAPTEAPVDTDAPQSSAAPDMNTPLAYADGYNPKIWGMNHSIMPEGSGPFFVVWQVSPVLPITTILNLDMLTHVTIGPPMKAALETEKIIVGKAHNLRDPNDPKGQAASTYSAYLTMGQFRHQSATYQGDPTADVVFPVFNNFGPNRTLAGILTAPIYWHMSLEGILPSEDISVICVMTNTQGQVFSYRVHGPNVTFLGPGDHHNTKYDAMMVQEDVMQTLIDNAGPQNHGYEAADLDTEYCSYSIRVYPSETLENQYLTNDTRTYTIVVAAIFLFTSIIFIAYDLFVARRQRIVMKRAVESGALVSSLYPKQVRDRLFEENSTKKGDGEKPWKIDNTLNGDIENVTGVHAGLSKAIAEYYENSTILFADLAGFTAWSAKRKPDEVFFLLETLYQAFDKIALRRKVYKIETVGDCYVAVTGVPEAQPDHAVIMCNFAKDCQVKMSQLISNVLEDKLGGDTANLSFRVGMHSGPITGGVLRGQKSRFQLFGDTINTASRVESNGVPNKIHVSQATADELKVHGYGSWLVPREDIVMAKGKGEMKTYFVDVTQTKSLGTKSSITISSGNESMEDDEDVAHKFAKGRNIGSIIEGDVEC